MKKPLTIVFFASPAGGKDTQANLLMESMVEKRMHVLHIGTGEEFRSLHSENYTKVLLTQKMNSGELLPDFLATSIVGSQLIQKLEAESDLFVNGYPRTINQAKTFSEMMKFYNRETTILFLKIGKEEAEKRIFNPENLRRRDDDSIKSISRRFRQFEEETLPIIEFFEFKEGFNVVPILGQKPIQEIHKEIISILFE